MSQADAACHRLTPVSDDDWNQADTTSPCKRLLLFDDVEAIINLPKPRPLEPPSPSQMPFATSYGSQSRTKDSQCAAPTPFRPIYPDRLALVPVPAPLPLSSSNRHQSRLSSTTPCRGLRF
eukprot:m.12937 g.12937  ORF g.12937 m.12937 type:complete len:121 (-) comp10057_c0_seq2:84-446(-)